MSNSATHDAGSIDTDALIIGAGPVGLFQVFELGLLEIKAHVIDSLPAVGGQCVELYPDKPIYDIPAVPVCTGQELADKLLKQSAPFAPTFHLNQEVTAVQRREDGRFNVGTSAGTRFIAKTIFIAAGVGSFQARKLKVDGIDAFEGSQLHYRIKDPSLFEGKHLLICGGGDSALDWALHFVGKAASVVLLHRRDDFRAAPASVAKIHALCQAGAMQRISGQITGFEVKDGKLSEVKVSGADGVTRRVPLDMLLVCFGLSPRLGPIVEWGLDLERHQLKVQNTEKFETNVPGIFAVGDINTYPGKKKLILSGFHEATLAAFGAAAYIFPDKKVHMLYTTTSPKLHKMLGVETPVFD
ncbi:NAD(P)/FAD-dependent oxidoreductase [Janthinobacterium sp.]|uniref:NAD(P)/FAD-dependent oxidoreductase n=1 Tax=Janthinobacterium sp. TaxID=1871054 RepID=UPI002DB5B119|nr:NAD(P)/FAD-dependent oxidoreductase [Janthinobacterium sp.]HEU4815286.1 NAD(P)/FAD-dependent oxidoreductase [Janthinobacterium sp.]